MEYEKQGAEEEEAAQPQPLSIDHLHFLGIATVPGVLLPSVKEDWPHASVCLQIES